MQKDMTVSDAHVTTALGNEKPKKRKARSFNEMLSVVSADDTEKRLVFDVRKVDADKQEIFGWASVCSVDGELVVDKQGDIIPVDEIEKGAYDFVQFSRDMGDMHNRLGTGRMIESMVFTKEKAACGVTATGDDGKVIEGWWVGFHVIDPHAWAAIKSGQRPELSIGGRASWEEA